MSERPAAAYTSLWLAEGVPERLFLQWREQRPRYLSLFAGDVVKLDLHEGSLEMSFSVGPEWGHAMGLQGGIVASMLDSAMAQCVILCSGFAYSPPTLELKVSYLERAPPGAFRARGDIAHRGASVVFLRGELTDGRGTLVATATATSRLVVRKMGVEL